MQSRKYEDKSWNKRTRSLLFFASLRLPEK
jgi:hypothetical protein